MTVIRKRKQKKAYSPIDDIDDKWLHDFFKLCGESAFNMTGHDWLRTQYVTGQTPSQAYSQCYTIYF